MEIIGTVTENRNISYGTIITYGLGRKEIMCNSNVCVGWRGFLYEEGSGISTATVLITSIVIACLHVCFPLWSVHRDVCLLSTGISIAQHRLIPVARHSAWHVTEAREMKRETREQHPFVHWVTKA